MSLGFRALVLDHLADLPGVEPRPEIVESPLDLVRWARKALQADR